LKSTAAKEGMIRLRNYEIVSAERVLQVPRHALLGYAGADELGDWPPDSGTGDAEELLGELDADGIDAEVLFPPFVTRPCGRDTSESVARAYNTWLSERFTATDADRLFGLAVIPATGIASAVRELRRAMSMPGIRGVVLTSWPSGSAAARAEDDEFWGHAVELRAPIAAYRTFGGGAAADDQASRVPKAEHFPRLTSLMTKGPGPYTGIQLINNGVLERFPELRFYFAHTDGAWVRFYREQADDYYKRHHYWAGVNLSIPPSEQIARHYWWGFTDDRLGVHLRHEVGIDRLCWGRGPLERTDPIETQALLKGQFATIPEGDRHQLLATNIMAFLDRG
jgi:predicted TIM-barrel fold metal-dependent hydrolase